MAFDFPASPVLDQTYTAHGVTFRWNGYAWAQSGSNFAPINSPVFTGDPQAPTPLTADNDTSIATTAFVKAQGYVTGGPYQPLDGDLTALAALAGTNVIYYRSAADTWSAVTVSTGLSFSSGTLSCTVSIAGLAPLASPTFTGDPKAPTPSVNDNDTSIATTAFVMGQLSNAAPSGLGDASAGGASTISRSDHVHPSAFRDYNVSFSSVPGNDLNNLILNGYYEAQSPANAPPSGDSWHHIQVQRHSNPANQFCVQRAWPLTTASQEWMRSCLGSGAAWGAWIRVDKATAYVSDTAPANANDGALWYESDSGLLYIRYNDGSSTQWVAIAARAEATP